MEHGARQHHRRQGPVGAAVHHDLDVHRLQAAFAIDAGAMADHRGMTLGGADDVVVTVVGDAHRPAGGARQERRVQGDHARIVLLAAEAAAHRRGLDPHLVGWQAQSVHQRAMHVVGALHRAVDDQGAVVLEPGGHRLALDVDVLLVAGGVAALDHELARRQSGVDVATRLLERAQRRLRLGRLERQHRIGRAIGDLESGQRPPRCQPARRRHQSHRLADVARLARGQDRPAVIQQHDAVGTGQVPGGDRHGAGRGQLRSPDEPLDRGAGMGTAQRRSVQQAFEPQVVAVDRGADGFGEAVGPRRARADAGHGPSLAGNRPREQGGATGRRTGG